MSNGTTTWSYTYNADGLRTKRTNGTTTYSYTYNGSQLSYMTAGSHSLRFVYGAAGPAAVIYDGTPYYYITNLQGDVTAIVDSTGAVVVTYSYNGWGKAYGPYGPMASTLGTYNPLRYRGYVYDTETGLYYLQSRYYDPELGRFINADGYVSTGQGIIGNNMFAYCGNNPVSFKDDSGTRYCAATTVNGESADERSAACVAQHKARATFDPYGNYFINDPKDLSNVKKETYENISKEEAIKYYETISAGNYSLFSNFSSSIIGAVCPSVLDWILSLFTDIGSTLTYGTYDPEGRLLYIEEGYTIITLEKFYWDQDYFATDIEYFIYDKQMNLVFNDVRGVVYMPGF